MGMDVYGRKPDAEVGEYFRNNVWWWRPLADYILEVTPAIASKCKYWHSNDGDGLTKTQALALADVLQGEIDNGSCAEYARFRENQHKALPDEPCTICGGTGKRAEPPQTGPGDRPCNVCGETGTRRPWATMYPFSVENVQAFVEFCHHSGGFRIC